MPLPLSGEKPGQRELICGFARILRRLAPPW
jgi:hypothetical protein